MRDIGTYTIDDGDELNVGPSYKKNGEPSRPRSESTHTLVDVPTLDNLLIDIIDAKYASMDSSSEEKPQTKRTKPQ